MRVALLVVGIVCRGQASTPNPCITCHLAEAKGYATTGMGKALSRDTSQPPGEFFHVPSATTFAVTQGNGGMHQQIARGGVSGEYGVAYVVGSGHRAFGYLVQIGNYLFQSPIAYQTQDRKWIMAPGYEDSATPD